MVLLMMASTRTCSPLLLLLDQDGKLRVSHQTPAFAFGVPWDARVPAKNSLSFLNFALKLIPGSFYQASPEPQIFEDPLLEESLIPDVAQFGDGMALLVLVIHELVQNF